MLDDSKCKCPNPKYCRTCQFEAGNAAGEAVCAVCMRKRYLYQGDCIKKCPVNTLPTNENSATGRECVVQP